MRKIFLFQLLILLSLNVYGGTSLTVEGRLTDATGIIPVSEADVDFTFKVYSADGTCLIYEEDHNNVDMSGSLGYFNLKLGSGPYIQGATYHNAMNNGLASISGVSCGHKKLCRCIY